MLSLEPHNIIDLYCWVDEVLPNRTKGRGGRPSLLADAELLTLLIWHTLAVRPATLKEAYEHAGLYHQNDFPALPSYSAFVDHAHRLLPQSLVLLRHLLADTAPDRIMDATMLPVCKPHRADTHKVAQKLAQFGKNHQGWHYGFKLHASIDLDGRFCGLHFTPANVYDAQVMPKILNEHAVTTCGDTLYGAGVMGKIVRDLFGTVIVAPPHPKQRTKLAARWQLSFLSLRSKIESVFDILKEHLHLVTSFPRSVRGYFVHYVHVLLAYQIMALVSGK